ncbi:hypothetical protein [Catalinimonas niigatensis]|uniref:hypothetical protein n=1 Tax=Catalinimonas niigatensis TaxID=1397264 RepID=UPI0026664896|nr:hypothetical protein [Catalinimonas niigatensis]WPP51231.1 hypothetical protein PZB72_02355 [Catalinimonas niigatensis]
MKEIRQLVRIIRKKGQRSIQLVNQNFRKHETSKDNLLYEGITNNKFLSDESAAREVFNTDPGNRNYRNAKGKLKNKLFNHLYFLDYDKESYTAYQKAEYDALHALHQCNILIKEGASNIAIRMLPQLIKTAKTFELTLIAIEALTLLRDQYAKAGKLTPFKEVDDELRKYRKFHEVRQKCEDVYFENMVQINKSISAQNRIVHRIPKVIEMIRAEAKKFNSQSLTILAAKLEITYNDIRWNFKENIKLCTELEKKYLNRNNHEIEVDLNQNAIIFSKLQAYLNLKEVKAGKAYASQKIDAVRSGSKNWFRFSEYYFLLLMKGEKYDEASNLFRIVRTNKNYNSLPESEKNRWHIYRAYLIFFNDSKILRWGFNLEEFLGAPPCHEKEFNGYNIATLAIQFLFLIKEGNISAINNCVQEIVKYKSAHLDKRHNYRGSIFIRLLEIVIDKEFDYEQIKEKGETYHKKLIKTPIPSDLSQDTEILPYEVLWDHILNIIKTNKAYIHFRFYNLNTA